MREQEKADWSLRRRRRSCRNTSWVFRPITELNDALQMVGM